MRRPDRKPPSRFALLLILLGAGLLPALAAASDEYAVYETQASFEDTLAAVKLAIEERGMYINNLMHMDEMLDRTGKDIGDERTLYGRAQSVEFCSAVLSREMAAEDPARIVYCPFILSVYTLPGTEGTTYLAHREIPRSAVAGSPAMAKVAAMLKDIATAAADW